jgi:hypothetical protein
MANKKKPGRKPGASVSFYTKAEDDLVRSVITNGKTNKENAEWLAKKLKRPLSSMSQRVIKFKKEMGLLRSTSRTSKMSKVEDLRSVVLPKNIALEFEASRCVLKENHIIIYFKG